MYYQNFPNSSRNYNKVSWSTFSNVSKVNWRTFLQVFENTIDYICLIFSTYICVFYYYMCFWCPPKRTPSKSHNIGLTVLSSRTQWSQCVRIHWRMFHHCATGPPSSYLYTCLLILQTYSLPTCRSEFRIQLQYCCMFLWKSASNSWFDLCIIASNYPHWN